MEAALVALAAASVASCNLIGTGCNGTSCGGALTIYFDGDVSSGQTLFDGGTVDGGAPADAIEIDIAAQVNQTFAPLKTCWLTLGTEREVVCEDDEGRLVAIDGALTVSESSTPLLQVTMSMNGTQLSQQTISPMYMSETCGCGAGTAHFGSAHIQLPPP